MVRLSTSAEARTRLGRLGLYPPAVGGGGGTPLPTAILALSPTGYWKLDDASGSFLDSSGNARHGTASGSVTYRGIAGGDGGSYMQGAGGRILVPDATAFSLTGAGLSGFALYRANDLGATSQRLITKYNVYPSSAEFIVQHNVASTDLSVVTYSASSSGPIRQQPRTGAVTVGAWRAVGFSISSPAASAYPLAHGSIGTPGAGITYAAGTMDDTTAQLGIGGSENATGPMSTGSALAHVAMFATTMTSTQFDTLVDSAIYDGWVLS